MDGKPETNVIAAIEAAEPVTYEYLKKKMETVRSQVAEGATDAELELFMTHCVRLNLDPFIGEVFFSKEIKRPIVSRDGWLKMLKRDPNFQVIDSWAVRETDEFEWINTESGPHFKHSLNIKHRGKVIAAYAIGRYKGLEYPSMRFVYLSEYDSGGRAWRNYPSAMIRKVAEVQVAKALLGKTGFYTEGELPEDDVAPENVIDLTPSHVYATASSANIDKDDEDLRSPEPSMAIPQPPQATQTPFVSKPAAHPTEPIPAAPTALEVDTNTEPQWFDIEKIRQLSDNLEGADSSRVALVYNKFLEALHERNLIPALNNVILKWYDELGVEFEGVDAVPSFMRFLSHEVNQHSSIRGGQIEIMQGIGTLLRTPNTDISDVESRRINLLSANYLDYMEEERNA